jgi:hypothetical protein
MDTTSIVQELEQVLKAAWAQGSPVAGSGSAQQAEIAAVAVRRIQSFPGRGVPGADASLQIVDLAKGLVAHFESNPELVGPLIKDYQHIAGLLLERYRSACAV